MSNLRVDNITDELGTGAPEFPNGLTTNSRLNFSDGVDAGIIDYEHADDSMRFTTATVEAMRVNGSGILQSAGGAAFVGTVATGATQGAIMEYGSNANGDFIKFADGTMFCRRTGSKNNGTTAAQTFTMPSTFASSSSMSLSITQTGASGTQSRLDSYTASSYAVVVQNVGDASLSTATRSFEMIAVGRWF